MLILFRVIVQSLQTCIDTYKNYFYIAEKWVDFLIHLLIK